MFDHFAPAICLHCGHSFDLIHPWVHLDPEADLADCLYCGLKTEVGHVTMSKARDARQDFLTPSVQSRI